MTFEESMLKCNTTMDSSDKWKMMKKTYDDYYLNYKGNKTPKIPKILHQIWIGGQPFPEKYKLLTDIWLTKHSDWNYILWTEREIEDFELVNKDLYNKVVNPAAKSDITRYEIMYSYGGIYVDIDFLCNKPFDDLLYLDFFCGNLGTYNKEKISTPNIPNSIFGCSQGNKMIGEIIRHVNSISTTPTTIAEIMEVTGTSMFSRKIIENIDKYELSVVLPTSFLYPFPSINRETIRNVSFADMQSIVSPFCYPETYATHLWYCSWQRMDLLQ